MNSISTLRKAIKTFEDFHRRSQFGSFGEGALYDLFPQESEPTISGVVASWPEKWPYADSKGIYAIFSKDQQLLYIGKASFRHSIGGRLAAYFVRESKEQPRCRLVHQWALEPRYVFTLAVPDDRSYEASALEEFLILHLNPLENIVGRAGGFQ